MKTLIVIVLAVFAVLLAGYGGVVSIERAFDETPIQSETALIAHPTGQDDGELVECPQKDVEEGEAQADAQVPPEDGKVRLGGLDFVNSLEIGLKEAKSKGRPAFVYFRSKSCGWCKKFEAEVLTDPRVISIIKGSFIPISIEVYEQGEIARRFKVRGTPTMVFLDGEANEIGRTRGYADAETFAATLAEMKSGLRSRD